MNAEPRSVTQRGEDEPSSTDDPGPSRSGGADARAGTEEAAVILDPNRLLTEGGVSWLGAMSRAAVAHLGLTGGVRVRLVDDDEMSRAHRAYCGVPGTTDVITFSLSEDEAVLDADLFVCVDEARRQADQRGIRVERELLLYVIHGVVHCMGHDDHDERDAARMHEIEDEVLTALGVGATYATQTGAAESPTIGRTSSTLAPGGVTENRA
ncbi:MAG: rRNA maturation RNase YbeY [Phycisphaerales bacterium]